MYQEFIYLSDLFENSSVVSVSGDIALETRVNCSFVSVRAVALHNADDRAPQPHDELCLREMDPTGADSRKTRKGHQTTYQREYTNSIYIPALNEMGWFEIKCNISIMYASSACIQ